MAQADTLDYKATILTPETAFPMKADLGRREPLVLARWEEQRVYAQALAARAGSPRFHFHDGPPYANGDIHYGHILNKVLKDFVTKWQLVSGRHCAFVPGWDCHGLPIELNVERALGPKRASLSTAEFRAACRVEAQRWIARQRDQFKRLGVFGTWEEPYLTMSPAYEAAVIRALGAFVRHGLVYRGRKPVYWSWAARSALAEAEVEYHERTDPSIYVKFAVREDGGLSRLRELTGAPPSLPLHALVWTTTPWTLPANLAIAVHPDFDYVVVEVPSRGEGWLVAAVLAESVLRECRVQGHVVGKPAKGRALEGLVARHPFVDRASPLLAGDHVTADTGTGLVHTAPGHGQDDYVLGLQHGLPAFAPVDDDGRFTSEAPAEWVGLRVFDANPKIVEKLAADGTLASPPELSLRHPYPHCWRTKTPIVFRATAQWFVALDRPMASDPNRRTLRQAALEEVDAVADGRWLRDDDERKGLGGSGWIPSWGRDRIRGMIEARPDWCISRQRAWGVPIPSFRCRACGEGVLTAESVEHVASVFEREGADAWFARDVAELRPDGFACRCGGTDFDKDQDILDVWFESGSSFAGAGFPLDPETPPVDLYLEGSDQHRGWFHSSLLVGVAAMGRAPYRRVLTHGFVCDEHGRPYSKSDLAKRRAAGEKVDYIDPEKLIATEGAELLRLWAAYEDYRGDVRYSRDHLTQVSDAYRKIRNTLRFALGNLKGFDATRTRDESAPFVLDAWARAQLRDYVRKVRRAYDAYDFRAVYLETLERCTGDWSAFYFDVLKDRLYCAAPDGPERLGAQATVYDVARSTIVALAPILCFTADDAWEHLPRRSGDGSSVFLATLDDLGEPDASLLAAGRLLLALRGRVNAAIEPRVKARDLAHRREADVTIALSPASREGIARFEPVLTEALAIAAACVVDGDTDEPAVEVRKSAYPRCARCWRHREDVDSARALCTRCAGVVGRR